MTSDSLEVRLASLASSVAHMQADITEMKERLNERPSIVAWIGAIVALAGTALAPAGVVYWRFSDSIAALERSDAAQARDIKMLSEIVQRQTDREDRTVEWQQHFIQDEEKRK